MGLPRWSWMVKCSTVSSFSPHGSSVQMVCLNSGWSPGSPCITTLVEPNQNLPSRTGHQHTTEDKNAADSFLWRQMQECHLIHGIDHCGIATIGLYHVTLFSLALVTTQIGCTPQPHLLPTEWVVILWFCKRKVELPSLSGWTNPDSTKIFSRLVRTSLVTPEIAAISPLN